MSVTRSSHSQLLRRLLSQDPRPLANHAEHTAVALSCRRHHGVPSLRIHRHDISVLQPDINESETDFTVLTEKQIRFWLGAIKGVGQIAIDSVL